MDNYEDMFRFIASNPNAAKNFLSILDEEISMPNIPMPTMGGEVFWNTLCEYKGWKLQQNMISHHARILDSNDIRIAWGTINGMIRALERFKKLSNF